jgi:hypothetical protein
MVCGRCNKMVMICKMCEGHVSSCDIATSPSNIHKNRFIPLFVIQEEKLLVENDKGKLNILLVIYMMLLKRLPYFQIYRLYRISTFLCLLPLVT